MFILFIVLLLLYMYYSSIMGIKKKKFAGFLIFIFTGVSRSEVGNSAFFKTFEDEEAIGAAIVQLFIAFLITVGLILFLMSEFFKLRLNDTTMNIVKVFILIVGIIVTVQIVQITNKYKSLQKN